MQPASAVNVLWITCDEMRWDALPCFGNAFTTMPAASRMAAEGIAFDHAFCQIPKCVPSRCSMLTGRYPHVDGFRTLRGRKNAPSFPGVASNDMLALQESTPNLIPLAREAGYRTCLLGKNHVVEWNLHKKWFDQTPSWDFDRVPKTETREDLKRAKYEGSVPDDFPLQRHCDAVTADEAIRFLEASRQQPFFAMVDMSLPHPCYHTFGSMPAAQLPLDAIPPPPFHPLEAVPFVERALRTSKKLEHLSDDDRRLIRRAYYSMCEFADHQVARILDALDQLDLTQNTLVIYGSDHGDFAADHNCFEKWDTAFPDCIVRVPLIMRLPGVIPAGVCSSALIELVDLFPTFLEAMRQDVPEYAQGSSLWPLMQGEIPADWRDSVICQGGVEKSLTRRPIEPGSPGTDAVKQQVLVDSPDSMARARMLRTARHKYIHRTAGGHELYDLIADPEELHNLANSAAAGPVLDAMRIKLLDRLIESDSTLPEISALYA